MASRLKRGDDVVVISGAHKGKRGKIMEIHSQKNRVVIEGVNLIKRHTRKSQDNPDGGIIEREGSIHISNVMQYETYKAKREKKGLKVEA